MIDREALSAIEFELWRWLYFFRIGKEGDRLREVVGDRPSSVVRYRVMKTGKNVRVKLGGAAT